MRIHNSPLKALPSPIDIIGHDNTQVRYLVANKPGHPLWRFRHIHRQIHVKEGDLQKLQSQIDRLGIELNRKKRMLTRHEGYSEPDVFATYDAQEWELDVIDLNDQLTEHIQAREALEQEVGILYEAIGPLQEELQEALDDKEKLAGLEVEMWASRAFQLLAFDFMSIGRAAQSTLELVFSLPESAKATLLPLMLQPPNCVNAYLGLEEPSQDDAPNNSKKLRPLH